MEVTPDISGVLCNPGDTPSKKKKKEVSFTLNEENPDMFPAYNNPGFDRALPQVNMGSTALSW